MIITTEKIVPDYGKANIDNEFVKERIKALKDDKEYNPEEEIKRGRPKKADDKAEAK